MTGVGGPKHSRGSATAGIGAFVAKMTAVSFEKLQTYLDRIIKIAYFESKCFSPTLPLSVGFARVFEVMKSNMSIALCCKSFKCYSYEFLLRIVSVCMHHDMSLD